MQLRPKQSFQNNTLNNPIHYHSLEHNQPAWNQNHFQHIQSKFNSSKTYRSQLPSPEPMDISSLNTRQSFYQINYITT